MFRMMAQHITSNIDQYVKVMEKRAEGALPEMGSAIRLSEVLRELVIDRTSFSVMDIGCATGHYYRSFIHRGLTPSKYIGVDIDPNMIKSAENIWGAECQSGLMSFLCRDAEDSPVPSTPTVDHVVCMNAFMYFVSAEKALEYMIGHAKSSVVIRGYFTDTSFKIIRSQTASNHDSSKVQEVDSIDREGNFKCFDLWNIYSFEYIESLVAKISPDCVVSWIEDKNHYASINEEKGLGVEKRAGTKLIEGYEVSYPIIQPWKYLVISRV